MIVSQVKYLGGIPGYDQLIERGTLKLSLSNEITFATRPKGLEVYLIRGFEKLRVGLFSSRINYWAFEPQKKLIEKKSKSIVGRALVGGILLGPVGAIVGGMTGLGDKEVSASINGCDNVLSISYTHTDEKEYLLVFDCSDKKAKNVLGFFNRNFSDKYKEEIEEEIEVSSNENTGINVTDELMKLKTLLDEGLITREEFDTQKNKLL